MCQVATQIPATGPADMPQVHSPCLPCRRGEAFVRNEPNSAKPAGGPAPWRGEMCETNPIWPGSAGTGGPNVRNEPKLRQGRTGRGRRVDGATVPRPLSLDPFVRNKPNFHQDRGPDSPSFHHSIVPALQSPASGLVWSGCTNKANRPSARWGASALWEKSYGAFGASRAWAEQSQLPLIGAAVGKSVAAGGVIP